MSRFLRNSFFGVIAGGGTTLGNFISGLVVARLLGVEGAGTVAVLLWLTNSSVAFAQGGVPSTIGRYLPEIATTSEERALEAAYFLLRPFLALLCLPVIFFALVAFLGFAQHPQAATGWLSKFPLSDPRAMALVAIAVACQGASDFIRGYLKGVQKFDALASVTIVSMGGQIAGIVAGGWWFGSNGAFAGYVAANILPLTQVWRLKGVRESLDAALKRRLLRFAACRWAAEVLATFVWFRMEILFLQLWWDADAVAYFSVGLTIANLATQGPLLLTWGLLPKLSEHFGLREHDAMRSAYATGTRLMALLVLPACLGSAAIMPQALTLLYGQAFAPATSAAIVLVCAASVPAVATIGANLIWAMDRVELDLILGVIGLVLSVASGMLVISKFGVMGAALSRAAVQSIVVALTAWALVERVGVTLPLRDLGRLLLAAALCAGFAWLVVTIVPGIAGLALAVPSSAVVYIAAVGWLRALPENDARKLEALSRRLPRPVSAAALMITAAIAPRAA